MLFVEDSSYNLLLLACDRRRLRQICQNLVMNAQSSRMQATTLFSVKKQPESLPDAAINTGRGIEAADQP
ncbi:MAG: hypothetical protein IT319_21350 [Anaerolineae bacterium]|nr:hypothetical protein [Anaerolineae bacterium]